MSNFIMTSKPQFLISSNDSTATLYFMISDIFIEKARHGLVIWKLFTDYLFMEDWMVIQQTVIFFESAVNQCPWRVLRDAIWWEVFVFHKGNQGSAALGWRWAVQQYSHFPSWSWQVLQVLYNMELHISYYLSPTHMYTKNPSLGHDFVNL